MASFHARSNSFPSQTHPLVIAVENRLERLKASQAASTSSICATLTSLRDLHDDINSMIETPSIQKSLACEQGENWINELLEGSLRPVDLCGFSREVACLTKESIQELESSIRRQADGFNAYVASRKRVGKMVGKCIKNLKISNRNDSALPNIGKILEEAESLDLSILMSVLIFLSGQKETSNKKSWLILLTKLSETRHTHFEMERENEADELCSLNIQKSRKNMDNKTMLKHLNTSETSIQEIEECLEALFRSLVRTRVFLLNVISH